MLSVLPYLHFHGHITDDVSARAGVDEVGRGPLAGPVVACAVVIDKTACLAGVRDSKQLSAARRSEVYSSLTAHPGVVWATYATVARALLLSARLGAHCALWRSKTTGLL